MVQMMKYLLEACDKLSRTMVPVGQQVNHKAFGLRLQYKWLYIGPAVMDCVSLANADSSSMSPSIPCFAPSTSLLNHDECLSLGALYQLP